MGEAIFGIVGTILGTILGWLLNSISNKGKLVFSVASWEDSFQRNDNMGSMVPSNSIEETQVYSYKLFLDVYNSSAETLIMRDIRIAFNDGKKDVHISVPQDDRTRRNSGPMSFYDNILPVNIPPKSVLQLHVHDGEWNQDHKMDFIWETERVFLLYKDMKNKEHRFLIKTEKYVEHFVAETKQIEENE